MYKKLKFIFQSCATFKDGFLLLKNTLLFSLLVRFRKGNNILVNHKVAEKYKMIFLDNEYDVYLRIQDITIFYEIFYLKSYFRDRRVDLQKSDSPINILDLGAHIGLFTLFMKINYFPNATFYCVEPSIENLKVLNKNLKFENIKIISKAIFKNCEGCFFEDSLIGFNQKVVDDDNKLNFVETIDIENLILKNDIKFIEVIKIDIEGSEKYVLDSVNTWLPITKFTFLELHSTITKEEVYSKTSHLLKHKI